MAPRTVTCACGTAFVVGNGSTRTACRRCEASVGYHGSPRAARRRLSRQTRGMCACGGDYLQVPLTNDTRCPMEGR